MNIVIDSNILFSALIKDSITRRLVLEYDGLFLFPEFIFEEINKHKEELLEKSGMKNEEFNVLLKILLKKVKIVEKGILLAYKKDALDIIKEIDVDDVIFIACALAYESSIIWSEDKRLKNQNKIRVLNTKEIIKILK